MIRLVISDCHIGNGRTKVQPLLEVLHRKLSETDELILNGDILDLLWTKGEITPDMKLLMRALMPFQRIVWVLGNHDQSITKCPMVIPPQARVIPDVYHLVDRKVSFSILHGHQADPLIIKHPRVDDFLVSLQAALYHQFNWDAQRWVRSFAWAQRGLEAQEEAIRTDPRYTGDIIISGHTHRPHQEGSYFNSGDWLQHRTYLRIEDGAVQLREA